ncbi:MAG TPA: hypothetical protein VMY38_03680, partial [Gemmatimonadaceae bacterium]|nr:hypothetical protein [Gemmatimonadaceae bacterium]
MANKSDRQSAILETIGSRRVSSQEELRRLLRGRGWDVTQATLSRDLRDLRVARVPSPDGPRYSAPDTGPPSALAIESILPQLFLRADGVGELIVMRTISGGAQSAAVALDSQGWPEVLGTVGGDDTVLIICRSASGRQKLLQRIRE